MSAPSGLVNFQWIWEGESHLAEDNYVNNWHFRHQFTPVSDFDNVRDMIRDFYTATAADQQNTILSHMTSRTISGKWTIKAYDLNDPKPRYPVYEDTGQAEVASGAALPTENSCVFSFQAERVAGEVQARRRNRVYLGPFDVPSNEDAYVDGQLVEDVLFAAKGLLNASNSAATWKWNIYSPTTNECWDILNGWVDNGWDTQRRRGKAATARGIFSQTDPEA